VTCSQECDGSPAPSGGGMSGLSVVVPVYNEEDNIRPLIKEIAAALSRLEIPSEIIFVDDGSSDETAKRIKSCQQEYPSLRMVSLGENRGQSSATVAGIHEARMSHIATMDGDMQNDPADLIKMVRFIKEYDVVIGKRRKRRDSLSRRAGSRIANLVRRIFLRDKASDSACSLRIFPRDVFLALPAFDGMHRFLPALFTYQQMRIIEVEVNHRPRLSGRAKYGNLSRRPWALIDLMGVMWLSRRTIRFHRRQNEE